MVINNRCNELRNRHKRFIYHDFSVESEHITFHFSIDDIHFKPQWTFNTPLTGEINLYAFNLGMAELVSYWKCACPPVIEVRCGLLSEWDVQWWKKLYLRGLGEFFYRNCIEPGNDFMQIITNGRELPPPEPRELSGCLIPVGGGKDSIVTMELLKPHGNLAYIINPRIPVLETAYLAGFTNESIAGVRRTIDKELLHLNSMGYLNGHTPFSSIIAFSGVLSAHLTGKKHLVLSNESSANEANVAGSDINHQYSKSAEFEADFREYSRRVFGIGSPEYFSLLRPWSEYQITKKFVSYPQYLSSFQSCNVGSKTDIWCSKCAKCLYVYIMLAAFLPDEKLIPVFGGNLLGNAELTSVFNGLVYEDTDKPFECVGTRAEVNLALSEALKRRENPPLLLKKYAETPHETPAPLDDYFDGNHFIPDKFLRLLHE